MGNSSGVVLLFLLKSGADIKKNAGVTHCNYWKHGVVLHFFSFFSF